MRYIEPTRVKVLMMMFFATGVLGIVIGLVVAPPTGNVKMLITFLGVINFGLGAFFAYLFLTQEKKAPDKRKKKKKRD